jgi:hypothetical protein
LIGAKPNHPIIHATIDWLAVHCDRLEKEYPGTDLDAVKNRITHRVVCALDNGIHAGTGHRDIILPPTAFSSSKATKTSFARHLHANSWLERVSDEQRKVLKRLHEMEHTSKIMMLSLIGLGGMNLGAALVMFSKTKKRKQ